MSKLPHLMYIALLCYSLHEFGFFLVLLISYFSQDDFVHNILLLSIYVLFNTV